MKRWFVYFASAMVFCTTALAQSKATITVVTKQIPVSGHTVLSVTLMNNSAQRIIVPDLRQERSHYLFHVFDGQGKELEPGVRKRPSTIGRFPILIEAEGDATEMVTLDDLTKDLPNGSYSMKIFDPEQPQWMTGEATNFQVAH